MAIRNTTARRLMYEWHGGMSSAFYAAASSGLCASFTALALECDSVDGPDKQKLLTWIQAQQKKNAPRYCVQGRFYAPLPWVSRDYQPAQKV